MGALKDAARKGRGGDTRLGHLTNGDVVFPAERLDEPTRALVFEIMKAKGVKDPHRFQVGHLHNAKNPRTRLPMFAEGGGTGAGDGGSGGSGSTGSGDSDTAGGGPGTGTGTGQGATAGNPGGIGGASPEGGTPSGAAPTPEALAAAPVSAQPGMSTATGPTVGIGNAIAGLSTDTTTTPGQTTQGTAQTGNPMGLEGLGLGIASDPVGTIAGLGINLGLGAIPGIGQALSIGNQLAQLAGLPGIGQAAVQGIEGLVGGHGLVAGAENASAGTSAGQTGGLGTGGPGDVNRDTGAGLRALGGGVGVNLDEMLKNRLGSSVNG